MTRKGLLVMFHGGENMKLRGIATPLTITTFIVVCFTGLCLLFGYRGGFVSQVHELSSILFVAGSILHIAVNWKPTLNHLKKPLVAGLAGCVMVVSVLAVMPSGDQETGGRKLVGTVMDVVLDANLSAVSTMTRQPEDALCSRLAQAGCGAIDQNASLREIARVNHKNPMEIVAVVMAKNPK
jgi:uncharacterized membrane protein